MARYLIYGAGGVGCLIGARLHLAGHDVSLVARGEHGHALAKGGLRFKTPEADDLIHLPVADDPSAFDLRPGDVVVMAMKVQDSAAALDRLAAVAPRGISLLCAQNGIEGERLALRHFQHVYGIYAFVFAAIIEPGTVGCYSHPCHGIVDVGRYPAGNDDRTAELARCFNEAGFESQPRQNIMDWKRGKLLVNLSNVLQAACSAHEELQSLTDALQDEARNCFNAARVGFISAEEVMQRGARTLSMGDIGGLPFPGGSTTQGLARGAPTSEADYLNGEIALLGRTWGIPTPVNAMLQRLMRDLVSGRIEPRSLTAEDLRRRLANA